MAIQMSPLTVASLLSTLISHFVFCCSSSFNLWCRCAVFYVFEFYIDIRIVDTFHRQPFFHLLSTAMTTFLFFFFFALFWLHFNYFKCKNMSVEREMIPICDYIYSYICECYQILLDNYWYEEIIYIASRVRSQ